MKYLDLIPTTGASNQLVKLQWGKQKKVLRERISSRVLLARRVFILGVFSLAVTILTWMENLSLLKWSRGLRSFVYLKM